MNDFLTSVFPRAYAKIYNGMIQLNGSSFVSKYTSNKEDMDPNKYIEKYATQRPSDQVYDALKCVYETNKAGYPQLLSHLKNDPGSFQMRKMSAVLLQIDENERWKKMYDAKGTQFDLLLAVPALSRIVSVSTTNLGPKGRKNIPKPFDVLSVGMYGFYKSFNKLHGTSHRSITVVKQTAMEKSNTFDSVKFILYTIQDAKTLAGCSNMELFAPHVINEKLVLGFTFLCVCKISQTKPSPALMFAPAHSMEFLINDDSGSVRAIMSPKAMESSSHLADAPAKLGMCDNTQSIQLEKFQDLDAGGYFMLLCSWPMGSDVPLIMCAMPLGEQLQHRGLYVEALMNTRRKLAIDDLDRLSGGGAEKIVQVLQVKDQTVFLLHHTFFSISRSHQSAKVQLTFSASEMILDRFSNARVVADIRLCLSRIHILEHHILDRLDAGLHIFRYTCLDPYPLCLMCILIQTRNH